MKKIAIILSLIGFSLAVSSQESESLQVSVKRHLRSNLGPYLDAKQTIDLDNDFKDNFLMRESHGTPILNAMKRRSKKKDC